MKRIFLDKDGTLTRPISGGQFVQYPEDQVLIEGVSDRLNRIQRLGYTFSIISNQGGIKWGYKTIAEAREEMEYAASLLPVPVVDLVFCPDDGETAHYWGIRSDTPHQWIEYTGKGDYRKPGAGMLSLCFDLSPAKHCWMVGDRPEDEGAAENAGIGFCSANTLGQENEFLSSDFMVQLLMIEAQQSFGLQEGDKEKIKTLLHFWEDWDGEQRKLFFRNIESYYPWEWVKEQGMIDSWEGDLLISSWYFSVTSNLPEHRS